MAFISEDDFKVRITDNRLQQLINSDTTILTDSIDTAIDNVVQCLSHRYDIQTELTKTDDERNKTLIRWIVSIAIYLLYDRAINLQKPKSVEDNYIEATTWLADIEAGKRNVTLTTINQADNTPVTIRKWTSQPKRTL